MLRARLEFGVTTRARLAAAAFAGHAPARELLGGQATVRDDAVTSEGMVHRGRITHEDSAGLLLQPGHSSYYSFGDIYFGSSPVTVTYGP